MSLRRAVAVGLAVLCTTQPIIAQTWMTDDGRMRISVKYRDNDEVRVETVGVQLRDPKVQFRVTLLATARATEEKGFPRFALIKITSCGMMNGYGITPCRFVARMLKAGESVPAKPGQTISHFDTQDLLRGDPKSAS